MSDGDWQMSQIEDYESGLDYIPSSYLDSEGTRRAIITFSDLPEYMELKKVDGRWELIDKAWIPF